MATAKIPPKAIQPEKPLISVKMALSAIVVLTILAFLATFRNGYVFWDDPEYILHNPLMSAPLSVVFNIKQYYLANYHPLTILVYTWEHKLFGDSMLGYHCVSLLLHIANSLLVFWFIYILLGKKNTIIPFVTAILFAIHPMHVESVAWASELKDVLYTFFFLSALVVYVMYIQSKLQLKFILACIVLFVLSLLSKGQAVTLPICLLLIDYLLKRKLGARMIIEKIPFFALSIFFGLVAIKAQNPDLTHHDSHIFDSFFWGMYGLSLYLYKFILPFNLSGLYPYPWTAGHGVPMMVYLVPLLLAPACLFILWYFRKDRFVIFGSLFFIGNIFTLLKFIPVGDAIIADRYSYISYIGLFFVVGYAFNKMLTNPKFKTNKKLIQYAGMAIVLVLTGMSHLRTMVWKDSITFWGDVIDKGANYWRAWYCIGQEYYNKGDYPNAIKYFSGGIKNDMFCPPTVYMWRGVTELEKTHNVDSAIYDFKKVLNFGNKADSSQFDGRLNLGLAYYRKGLYDSAINIYNELLTMAPGETPGYFQRGLAYQYSNHPEPEKALADYTKAIQMNPNYAAAYINRGALYVDQLGRYDLAMADFNKTLELEPDNSDAMVNRGIAFYKMGKYDEALNVYSHIPDRGKDNGKVFYLKAIAFAAKNDFQDALENAEQAQKLGVKMDASLLAQWKGKVRN